jgi:hypothetical protein
MKNKYTFEDWLNDKINYRFLGLNVMKVQNGLYTLYKGEGLMSKHDYEQIKKHQLIA